MLSADLNPVLSGDLPSTEQFLVLKEDHNEGLWGEERSQLDLIRTPTEKNPVRSKRVEKNMELKLIGVKSLFKTILYNGQTQCIDYADNL